MRRAAPALPCPNPCSSPALRADRLVEANPAMLDVPGLQKAMAEAQRIMPQLDVQKAMATDPQLIFSFQTGNQLIP